MRPKLKERKREWHRVWFSETINTLFNNFEKKLWPVALPAYFEKFFFALFFFLSTRTITKSWKLQKKSFLDQILTIFFLKIMLEGPLIFFYFFSHIFLVRNIMFLAYSGVGENEQWEKTDRFLALMACHRQTISWN